MGPLALALLLGAAPAASVAIAVDGEGIALVSEEGVRSPIQADALAGHVPAGSAATLTLAPEARVVDVRAVVEAFVAAGATSGASSALEAVLGPPGHPTCALDDDAGACAMARVSILPTGVIVSGAIGATNATRACGPVRVRPLLIGRSDDALRTYSAGKRTGRWDELAAVFAAAHEGGGSQVCATVLLEEIEPSVTLAQWLLVEKAARAAGYSGTARPPWVRDLVRSGSLSKPAIKRVIDNHQAQLRFCYEKQLSKQPALAGKVGTYFEIEPDGRVSGVRIEDEMGDGGVVAACVKRVVERMRFPQPHGGGKVTVGYPFVFVIDKKPDAKPWWNLFGLCG